MSEQVKIAKINIKIAGQELELTLEQARELRGILNELWPEPVKELVYPPVTWPSNPPILINKPPQTDPWKTWPSYPTWSQPTVTYNAAGAATGTLNLCAQ